MRVCDGLACEMAGAEDLLAQLPALLGEDVRVIAAPCIGRCEQAPVAVVPVPGAACRTRPAVQARRHRGRETVRLRAGALAERSVTARRRCGAGLRRLRRLSRGGGYALAAECVAGERDVEALIKTIEDSGLRGLGGAGFPAGRKWRIVREQPAPRLMAVNIDEGEPGTFKDRVYLERDPHRFLEGMLIAAWAVGIERIYVYLRDEYHGCRALLEAELGEAAARSAACALPQIDLRRGAGAYICGEESAMIEIDRRQARHAAAAPAVRRAGRPVRPADAGAQLRDAVLGARDLEKGARLVRRPWPQRAQGPALFRCRGRVKKPGVQARAGRHHDPGLIDEYCGGMLEGHVLRLPARRRLGRHPAGLDGRHSARLRHAAAPRLLHRLGRGDRAVSDHDSAATRR